MSDEQQIRDTIRTYFDCMYESSADKTHAAFHPNAKITGYLEDKLYEMSVGDFADFVTSQQPSAGKKESPSDLMSYQSISPEIRLSRGCETTTLA